MDAWLLNIPVPVALAVVATVGYLFGRRSPMAADTPLAQSRRELRRAQAVARELEKIAGSVRTDLAKHSASIGRFKRRVDQLSAPDKEDAWQDLCKEAEEMLKPTMRLATQISAAYDQIRQQTNSLMTFTESRTDPLTGVSNRRGLDSTLDSQLAILVRYRTVFSLAIFDIDHFKAVNDKHGHLHGDEILQQVASLLDEKARETDTVARYGGEEFVVVMPQTGLDGAGVFAQRMREAIAERLSVTVSGGVTAAVDTDTSKSLLARADAALYHAKRAGRNRVFRSIGSRTEAVVDLAEAVSP